MHKYNFGKWWYLVLGILFMLGFVGGMRVQAKGLKDNPNISFSGDGMAFTTDRGETAYDRYPVNSSVNTGETGSLPALKKGMHYYKTTNRDKVTVERWNVKKSPGACIHDSYGVENGWHGITFRTKKCGASFKCGWTAICADCKEEIPILFYMDKETAKSLGELPLTLDYYYLCPLCQNLEQGRPVKHECKDISYNKYWVNYDKNHSDATGYMEESVCYYDNAEYYEGHRVVGEKKLRKNTYHRQGFSFRGWNTKSDGTGTWYEDEQEVRNLCEKDKETITLYAIWEISESTLHIDPGEGMYDGENKVFSVTRPYGSVYTISVNRLTAPKGYTVSFETNGAGSINPVVALQKWAGWKPVGDLKGQLIEREYSFLGENGAEDTVLALYERQPIILPTPTRRNMTFGGWYEDKECKKPAGMGGKEYLPNKNITLYARWVNLVLQSKPDLLANGRKGAVDLSWEQQDETSKSFLVYQKTGTKEFVQIGEEGQILEDTEPIKIAFTGKQEYIRVPATGVYELTARGAQGQSTNSLSGGPGGEAKGRFFLRKGDKLTLQVGGRKGYPNGGKGTTFGSGGGATIITSEQMGVLLIGAGGGGATDGAPGGAGGLKTGLRTDGVSTGQKGDCGGGGGKVGGKAGEYLVHEHGEECFETINLSRNELEQPKGAYSARVYHMHTVDNVINPGTGDVKIGGHNRGDISQHCESHICIENIPVKGYEKLSFEMEMCAEGGNQGAFLEEAGYLSVNFKDQNGDRLCGVNRDCARVIPDTKTDDSQYESRKREYEKAAESVIWTVKNVQTTAVIQYIKFVVELELPQGVTSVSIETRCMTDNQKFHYQSQTLNRIYLTGEKQVQICPYDDGQVLINKPSHGGSNYISKDALFGKEQSGLRQGNGQAVVELLIGGVSENLSLDDVAAPDEKAPGKVNEKGVLKEALGEKLIRLSWEKPADFGNSYYHKVESVDPVTGTKICTSNITKDEIITGIKGYYTLWNGKENTTVTAENADFIRDNFLTYQPENTTRYLHLAPVDKAGNLGDTIHIACSLDDEDVYWKPVTGNVEITDSPGGNSYHGIYQKEERTWYVRADGCTPFGLAFPAILSGPARIDYQVDRMYFNALYDGESQKIQMTVPRGNVALLSEEIPADDISVEVSNAGALRPVVFREGNRKQKAASLWILQGFTLGTEYDDKKITVYPSASAESKKGLVFSDSSKDMANQIMLIGDGKPPTIYGSEGLQAGYETADYEELLNSHYDLWASDMGSGIDSFTMTVTDAQTFGMLCLTADDTGHIRFCPMEDFPDFCSDMEIRLCAVDRVGNESTESFRFSGCGISASISRILSPHDPVFKSGESGILHISAWGNVEKITVEFPEELTALNPGLNTTYTYTQSSWMREENLQFMVPLYTPPGEHYQVVITGYKSGTNLDKNPTVCTFMVTDSVLDELRTRLR